MRFALAAAATLAFSLPAAAQSLEIPSGTYVNDVTHTSILWKVSHFGYSTYTGAFARDAAAAVVTLDADDVANSRLEVTLDGGAVRTLHPVDADPRRTDFDAEIASATFLNAETNPTITFRSTSIEVTGEDSATITGDLTINGKTHPLVLETHLNAAANHPMTGAPMFGISARGTLDRTLWGINTLAGPIGTDVAIEIEAEFAQQQD
jgi:polyisoprenoid-binding protein YceI